MERIHDSKSRPLLLRIQQMGTENDAEFSESEAMSLEKMSGAMLAYDPTKAGDCQAHKEVGLDEPMGSSCSTETDDVHPIALMAREAFGVKRHLEEPALRGRCSLSVGTLR